MHKMTGFLGAAMVAGAMLAACKANPHTETRPWSQIPAPGYSYDPAGQQGAATIPSTQPATQMNTMMVLPVTSSTR